MSDRARPDEQFLDLPADETMTGEHLDDQVQRAQEQLLSLNRQRDLIERQKRELEELSRRQEQFHQGKAEMVEKFTHSLVVLERESHDAQRRVDTLSAIHDSFSQHLEILDAINPKTWDAQDISKELTRALSAVDDAHTEYARSLPKISVERDAASIESGAAGSGYQADFGAADAKDFFYWLKAGFAFTLPLFAIGIILVIVLVAVFNR